MTHEFTHTRRVNSALSGIPIERRRRTAATLGLFAALCITIGVVAMTGSGTPGVVRVFSAISLALAVVLGLVAWGVAHSVSIDQAEQRLDAAIEATVADRVAKGHRDVGCACGHDHDPNEMHVTDAAPDGRHGIEADNCAHDGAGDDCAHNCVSCVLRTMRPSPNATRAQRMRTTS